MPSTIGFLWGHYFLFMLSETALQDFKRIYKEEYGKDISDKEALELGVNLLTLFNHIYKPIKKEWSSEISNKDELIRYLLIRIGFTLPLKIEGVVDYISILKSYKTQVESAMKDDVIAGIMNNVYVASENNPKRLDLF